MLVRGQLVDRAIVAVAFPSDVASGAVGDATLGLVGWCAYRAAGGAAEELPSAGELVV